MIRLYPVFILLLAAGCADTDKETAPGDIKADTVSIVKVTFPATVTDTGSSKNLINPNDKPGPGSMSIDDDFIQKATIESDSSFYVAGNIRADYRIFGYEKADTASRKMILFSVFTPDVEGNPYQCPFGSYYQSSSLTEYDIKYTATTGKFIKASILKNAKIVSTVYFERKWVQFS